MRLTPFVRAEIWNVVKRAVNPLFAFALLANIAILVIRRAARRFWGPLIFYPPQVRRGVEVVAANVQEVIGAVTRASSSGSGRLRLAVGHLFFDDTPDWRRTFTDSEQFVSLHRWNWLLRALTDESGKPDFDWGCGLIRSWLATMTPLPAGLASESYSVGERIANACLFARLTTGSWCALPEDIAAALDTMAQHLARHIEYQGGEMTGNHAVNNARALYIAGLSLKRPAFTRLAQLVLAERLPALITADGFMREGSSHYHFLFTRWLLEVRLAAEEHGDSEMLSLLGPDTVRLVERCWFFLVSTGDGRVALPTIGDVSPDCEPAWLLDLPWSAPALSCHAPDGILPRSGSCGWARLWDAESPTQLVGNASSSRVSCDSWLSYPESGWHRLNWKGWTAIWHTESGAGTAIASHAHHDLCSFVLYRDGREVLIDPGRYDYEPQSETGAYGVFAAAHNSVCLDGIGPMLSRRDRLLPPVYRSGGVRVTAAPRDGGFAISIAHDGFLRLAGGGVRHERSFFFSDDRVEIEDTFIGHGQRRLEVFFQWAMPPKVQEARYAASHRSMGLEGPSCRIESDLAGKRDAEVELLQGSEHPLAGWRFPAYGERRSCVTQRIRSDIRLPASCRHVIALDSR